MNHGKNILITGASGLLGRSLMVRLKDLATVTGVGYSNRAESLVPVDLRDADALHNLLNEAKPDAVVHSAAYRDPDFCEDHPEEAFRLNVAQVDVDEQPAPKTALWWRPRWKSASNYPGSGTFVRK